MAGRKISTDEKFRQAGEKAARAKKYGYGCRWAKTVIGTEKQADGNI